MTIILPITVVAFETDFGGVVSNTRYLEYMERGRYALLHATGLKISQVWETHGVQPVVRSAQVEYLGFARHEDDLELSVTVKEHSRATSTLSYELVRLESESTLGSTLMRGEQTLAYLNTRWRPVHVPEIYREALPVER
jgi:YbgC/YbaW family acyl-CoA thioester hydrolase